MNDLFTEDERQYVLGFRPAGFIRAWRAIYQQKCIAGPWSFSGSRFVFGSTLYAALERGNRAGFERDWFGDILGWHVRIPLLFGTASIWGYRRCNK